MSDRGKVESRKSQRRGPGAEQRIRPPSVIGMNGNGGDLLQMWTPAFWDNRELAVGRRIQTKPSDTYRYLNT